MKDIVIVIDPGHGGENKGGEFDSYVEKDMNPVVATAMKEHLEKFDGITVYLTHDTDVDMSIQKRADFANSVNADFVFCLHFNLSVSHNLFGAEVWIPSTGELYAKSYAFAEIEMNELTDLGLYSRGIKTKLNDNDLDYYGILRYCTDYQIPAALIEHCHMDHPNDTWLIDRNREQLTALGIQDAEAAAKYFHLKSDILQEDYTDYPVSSIEIPADIVRPDETEPEVNEIEVLEVDQDTGTLQLQMTAMDSDSYIQYYMVSTDGGNTYSQLYEWPRPKVWNQSDNTFSFTLSVPYDQPLQIRTAAYNSFDKVTESNILSVAALKKPTEKTDLQEAINYEEITYETEDTSHSFFTSTSRVIITISVTVCLLLIITFILIKSLSKIRRHRK